MKSENLDPEKRQPAHHSIEIEGESVHVGPDAGPIEQIELRLTVNVRKQADMTHDTMHELTGELLAYCGLPDLGSLYTRDELVVVFTILGRVAAMRSEIGKILTGALGSGVFRKYETQRGEPRATGLRILRSAVDNCLMHGAVHGFRASADAVRDEARRLEASGPNAGLADRPNRGDRSREK